MDVRYAWRDPREASLQELLEALYRLFQHLLLQVDGDVEAALGWLERIAERHGLLGERLSIEDFRRWLESRRAVAQDPSGALRLTARGEKGLRVSALEELFGELRRDAAGEHRVPHAGAGLERLPETRPWSFGDSFALVDAGASLSNALRRSGGLDLELREEDLEVHETEHASSCATVLLIDVSHSMVLYGEDRITPAKKVALAMAELVTTRYPKDSLDVVLFGDEAWQVPLEDLPYVGVGPFHTNTRAGLVLARELLRKKRQANRRILMVTDGKPSALTERDGSIYKNPFGLDRRVVNKTLEEAATCRRLGIPVTTFMLTEDPTLVEFVESFTRTNRGRACFASPERLGRYVFVDYLRNRRRRV